MDIKYIALALVLVSGPAWADSINLSIGHNKAGFRDRCNLRQTQSPLPQTIDIHSDAWAIGYTKETSWFPVTLDYWRNGKNRASGTFVSNDGDCAAHRWFNVPTVIAQWVTQSQGLRLTADPVLYQSGKFSVSGSLGFIYFKDKGTLHSQSSADGPIAKARFEDQATTYDVGLKVFYDSIGIAYHYTG